MISEVDGDITIHLVRVSQTDIRAGAARLKERPASSASSSKVMRTVPPLVIDVAD